MEVPYQEIPAQTLRALIEEFVSRDGTDYGRVELSLEEKVAQVQHLLACNKAVIWFDKATETISIFHRDDMARMNEY